MSEIITIDSKVASKIIEVGGQQVIIDSDVAELYGVETKHINQAVKNNPDKFPSDFIIALELEEKRELVKNFDRFESMKHSSVMPKAFTEQGLYMLATILKSPIATATTISIIKTFTKVREIKRTVIDVVSAGEKDINPKGLIEHVGSLVGELIMPDDSELETISIESESKFKFMGVLEFSRKTIKKPKK